ncbi:proton-conducting transporter membrane subunit [Parvularcula sp. LCG005]|uniref:proton-conducting transporter transmembrane domain-containing protein n=1 Tax=Parvularcula sp. LCG005 TaxID=3078805 RepID=UPI002942913A|nr:proton-conducting transporter membrane subunit [Parvularcula sp. LCG005]WOI53967.1 proton-conducting transporter membrane subunit [Parvularcula sp. LCG005]
MLPTLPLAAEDAILFALFIPLIGFFGLMFTSKSPNLREGVTLTFAVLTFLMVLTILADVIAGGRPSVTLFEMLPGLSISFTVEPLGAMFATIASGLFIVNSCYSIGYMRGNNEKHQTRFYMCFAIAIAAALGIAFAGNLLTFFAFYELLTISTFPLVTHKRDEKARAGGRVYLGILVGTSIGLLLPAVIWTYVMTGTTDFTLGGILSDAPDMRGWVPVVLLGLFLWGVGKAALMPFHPWLPNAMVAPTPVSAFLHAVAVVKAGVFGVLKIAVYVFGVDYLSGSSATDFFLWVAGLSILLASAIAMTQDNLKSRLAYSTISQLSYVTLGALIANQMGVLGGATQIAAHALGKMTLFMCAGAIYTSLHKSNISEMRGTGRQMPWTWAAYIIGACSIIGLPPMAGSWPKFYLMLGAVDRGTLMLIIVLIVSSLMNIVYLLAPAARAFMDPRPDGSTGAIRMQEAPLFCLIPAYVTAIGTIILFFFMDSLVGFLEPILGAS